MKDGTTLVSGFGLAYADGLNLAGVTDQVAAANSNVLSYTPANRRKLELGLEEFYQCQPESK